jgi:hypothetical protein
MHLLYLDDSGSILDSSQQYFVLAGLSVFERQGHWIAKELDSVAGRFSPGEPRAVELHGSPMLTGVKFWRRIPLPDRIQAIKDALQVLADSPSSTRVFAAVVRKSAVLPRDPVEFAFEHICMRFDHWLMRLHKGGDTQRGLILFDKSAQELALQSLATDFRETGHQYGILRNLAEVPVFLDSRSSRLIQLADLVAYAVFRRFERGDSQFFDIIEPRFDRSGGVVHGLFVHDKAIGVEPQPAC